MNLKCDVWPVAVCSWSLRTNPDGVADAMRQLGIGHVNLTLRPVFADDGEAYLNAIRRQRWSISATTIGFPQEDYSSLESIRATGGILPDDCWPRNQEMVMRAAAITAELGVRFLTMHAGFIESDDAARARRLRDRLVSLANEAARRGIMLLMETGQETAGCLRELLEELRHPALGVNFDPANMILYDKGDPVAAVRTLGPWIRHVHIKDAVRTKQPGTWGAEVPWGDGEVGTTAFLDALKEVGFAGVLAIEREAGNNRLGDIQLAADRLARYGGSKGAI